MIFVAYSPQSRYEFPFSRGVEIGFSIFLEIATKTKKMVANACFLSAALDRSYCIEEIKFARLSPFDGGTCGI